MPTILTAGDSVSAASSLAASNDGLLNIVVGPAGGKVTAVAIAADGTPTFIKQPVLPVQSMVRLHTANGYGSTNTAIRRFTTVVTNQGSDITYVDSATLGATFTINSAGVFSVSTTDSFSVAATIGLSFNSTQLTTPVQSITAADRLASSATAAADFSQCLSVTLYLPSGSVIRAHHAGAPTGATATITNFTITRIA